MRRAEGQVFIDDYRSKVANPEEGNTIIAETSSFTPQPQSSMVIIEQNTGKVKAIVGGRGEKTASLTLNRATNTTRQPGSTFKVLAAYSNAIDTGKLTLGTVIVDEPYKYSDGTDVHNWLTDTYQGNLTVRDGIANSVNVLAVKAITEYSSPEDAYNQLLKFGFTTLSNRYDVYQPLALGGIYNGVSNLELTAAYAALANDGTYIKPIFYTSITDNDGNVIIDNTPEETHAVNKYTAALLTSAMQDVVMVGTGQNLQLECGMPVAGKTGTTSDYNDVWFVGYTPYYTCGVWAGYDRDEHLPDEGIGHTYHQILWKKVMNRMENSDTNNEPIKLAVPLTMLDMLIRLTKADHSAFSRSVTCWRRSSTPYLRSGLSYWLSQSWMLSPTDEMSRVVKYLISLTMAGISR